MWGPLALGPAGSDPMSAAPTSADPVPTGHAASSGRQVILIIWRINTELLTHNHLTMKIPSHSATLLSDVQRSSLQLSETIYNFSAERAQPRNLHHVTKLSVPSEYIIYINK